MTRFIAQGQAGENARCYHAPHSPAVMNHPSEHTIVWQRLWRQPSFKAGVDDMLPVSLGIGAWGLVTGVAMVKSGLSVPIALWMTALVFAGSAQLASLPLLAAHAPVWVILLTAFCVNLRFVIFSAQWRPYFHHLRRYRRLMMGYFAGDLNFVLFTKRFPDPSPAPDQLPYFWGGVIVNWIAWQACAVTGILLADQIPTQWGLGFAGVLALLGLAYSLLKDWVSISAAVAATAAAVVAYDLPFKLNIIVAIAAAMLVGRVGEHFERRQASPREVGGATLTSAPGATPSKD
jgi:predicted branched-subunit amino acid permease